MKEQRPVHFKCCLKASIKYHFTHKSAKFKTEGKVLTFILQKRFNCFEFKLRAAVTELHVVSMYTYETPKRTQAIYTYEI